jgi:hypothetical protein
MIGYLQLDGWEGRTQQEVEIIDEAPKKYRIKAMHKTRLGGRSRWLQPGESTLVPKHAVTKEKKNNVPVVNLS